MTEKIEVTAEELENELRSEFPPVLLDVRELPELESGVLPGAVCVPMSQLQARWQELNMAKRHIVYCAHGVRSFNVAMWLKEKGMDACSLTGGIVGYPGQKLPYVG